MKVLCLVWVFLLMPIVCSADVSYKVLTYEKEVSDGNPIIKVTTEYIYPDGTKHLGVTRYGYHNFSKANVEKDAEWHCETITKYYIKENAVIMADRKDEMINDFIAEQDIAIGQDKITNLQGVLKDFYLDDMDITIPATGTIKDEYK